MAAASEGFNRDQVRKFFETHLGSLPHRDQISTRCIFHEDSSPSLSINLAKGVWKCHAGCGEGGILDFQAKASGVSCDAARALVNDACGIRMGGGEQPEAIYRYRDAQGRPLFEKLRYPGKRFRNRRWTPEGFIWNLDGVSKPLYNLPEVLTANDIFVVEGEKDADNLNAALRDLGQDDFHVAVTTNFDGAGKWSDEYNGYFLGKRVTILGDNDAIGRQHAEQVAAALHPVAAGVKIVSLPGLPEHGDVSDYLADEHTVGDLIEEVKKTPRWFPQSESETPAWRAAFKSYDQLEPGKLEFLIERIIPEGITFLGGLPASGKTWLALSIAKALMTGRPFLGSFPVPHPLSVLYLIPEAGERAFRTRLEAMRLTFPEDLFLCRTMGSGPTLALKSPEVIAAVGAMQPVVFLDTAIRFSQADDENSAAQNRELATAMFELRRAGAKGIVAIHHSAKNAGKDGSAPTLENTLRGTGDLGALADAVYNLRVEDMSTLTIGVTCVKPRDFEPVAPFRIQGRPFINDRGDFAMLEMPSDDEKIHRALLDDSTLNARELAAATGISVNRVTQLANRLGWKKNKRTWEREEHLVQ
jgi:hypothetical protein